MQQLALLQCNVRRRCRREEGYGKIKKQNKKIRNKMLWHPVNRRVRDGRHILFLVIQSAMKWTNVTGNAPLLIGSPSMWPTCEEEVRLEGMKKQWNTHHNTWNTSLQLNIGLYKQLNGFHPDDPILRNNSLWIILWIVKKNIKCQQIMTIFIRNYDREGLSPKA